MRIDLFVQTLTRKLGRPVVAEIAPTYEAMDLEVARGEVDLVWATADLCDTFESRARAVLRAVRGGHCYYHSALVCRAEEPLTPRTLKGKRAAWVDPRSIGGYRLPMRYMEARGLDPTEEFSEQRFLGTYRKTLLAVLTGEADVASIYLSHPDVHSARAAMAQYIGADERRLTPFAFTEPTLADGLILTQRLSEEDTTTLVSLLTGMNSDGGGLGMMLGPFKVDGFTRAPSVRPGPSPARRVARSEYVTLELDEAERCHRVWVPTGWIFGRNVRGGEGRTLAELLGTEASGTLLALVRAARHSGLAGRGEYRLEVEGETHWYTAEATAHVPSPGEPDPGLTALMVRDITELRMLEEPLFRLATFPLLHPEPMLELSLEGELRHANPITHRRFPDLQVRGAGHPLVEAALD